MRYHPRWTADRVHTFRPVIQKVLYNFFCNTAKNDPEVQAAKLAATGPNTSLARPKKVDAGELYAKAHADEVRDEVARQVGPKVTSSKFTLGVCRKVISEKYNALEPPERAKYKNLAAEKRAQQVITARLPVLEHQGQVVFFFRSLLSSQSWLVICSFLKGFLSDLRTMTEAARLVVGLSFTGIFSFETEDEAGQPHIEVDSYTSRNISAFVQTEEHGDMLARFGQWYRVEMGRAVKGLAPSPDIIPDAKNYYRPIYPLEIGDRPRAHSLRNMNRHFFNAYHRKFFVDSLTLAAAVPYRFLAEEYQAGRIKHWIPNWPDAVPFDDFSRLTYDDNLALFNIFRRAQEAEAPETCLWFAQAIAGTTRPTKVDASDVTTIEVDNRAVYVLHYDEPVSQPQSDTPIAYPESAWRYYYHIGHQRTLDHWCGLHSASYDPTVTLISNDTIEFVQSVFDPVDRELSRTVVGLMQAVNAIEKFGPHTTPEGIWGSMGARKRPTFLPGAKPVNCASFISLSIRQYWLDPSYCMSAFAAEQAGIQVDATFGNVLAWAESMMSAALVHGQSKTLQGGDGGVVWVVVVLVRVLLNTSVRALKTSTYQDPPADLDLENLATEHQKVVRLLQRLSVLLESTRKILAESSRERVAVCKAFLSQPDEVDAESPTGPEDGGEAGHDQSLQPVSGPPDSSRPAKGKRPGNKSVAVTTKATPARIKLPKGQGPGSKKKFTAKSTTGPVPNASTISTKGSSFGALNVSEDEYVISSRETSPIPPALSIDCAWFEPRATPINVDFSKREHYYGPLSAQPKVPPHPGNAQDLIADFHTYHTLLNKSLDAWTSFDAAFRPYPLVALRQAEALAKRDPRPNLRRLIQGILLQRFLINRCRDLWPKVVELMAPIVSATRNLTAIGKAMDAMESWSVDDKLLRGSVRKVRRELDHDIQGGREVMQAVTSYAGLTTWWANELKDGWEVDISLLDMPAVMTLSHGLASWRNEADDLKINLDKVNISLHLTHELNNPTRKTRFHAGCPDPGIFDGAANGCLIAYPKPPFPERLAERDDGHDTDAAAHESAAAAAGNPPQSPQRAGAAVKPLSVAPPAAEPRQNPDLSAVEPTPGPPPAVTTPSIAVLQNDAASPPRSTDISAGPVNQQTTGVAPLANPPPAATEDMTGDATLMDVDGDGEKGGQSAGEDGVSNAMAEVGTGAGAGAEAGVITGGRLTRRSHRLAAGEHVVEPEVVKPPEQNVAKKGKARKRGHDEAALEDDDLEVIRMQVGKQTAGAGSSSKADKVSVPSKQSRASVGKRGKRK
ncbi:hypothetical protein FRC07_013101 [Ceratobasidium sp. 392]|nr:hypothetical protein FRC07_013101 [Ceratobasidium sp. 392]